MTAEELERRQRENLEIIADFCLMDDEFMTKCFEGDPKYIQLVLRIILDMPDLKVVAVRTQEFVENLLHRSLRLDVKAVDSRGRWINVEIQRRDDGAGRKRVRYRSSMMDAGLLEKGADFEDLPEVWVIFITEHDVIGRGLPLYRVERCMMDTGEPFGDGSHILYVNGENRSDTPLGWLMHDFFCKNPAEMHYPELAERTRFFKESKEGVAKMSRVMDRIMEERLNRERIAAEAKGKAEIVLHILRKGQNSPEEVALMTGLSLEEVLRLSMGAAS